MSDQGKKADKLGRRGFFRMALGALGLAKAMGVPALISAPLEKAVEAAVTSASANTTMVTSVWTVQGPFFSLATLPDDPALTESSGSVTTGTVNLEVRGGEYVVFSSSWSEKA